MALKKLISQRETGLRIAEELTSIGVLSGSEVWDPYEPNSYPDFGGEATVVAREPMNPDRQRKKGTKVDEDSAFGLNTDWTQNNLQSILRGFMFAEFRPKGEEVPTEATGTTDLFNLASTTGFFVGSLVFVTGFVNVANNGLHVVSAVVTDVTIEVIASSLVTETPPATANIVVVGFEFAAGDLDVTIPGSGALPQYTATAKNLTELGLIPGEWIFVGGDAAALAFANLTGTDEINNGFKRIRSIVAGAMEVDKSDFTLTVEASTTETIHVFFGRVLKNETSGSIVRRTYQAERQLGAPDDALPAEIQAQYEVGGVANELTIQIPKNDILKADLGFIALREDRVDGPTALKAGTRPTLVEEAAINTATDFKRIALTPVEAGVENSTPLAAFIDAATVTINNGVEAEKAVGQRGGFDAVDGDFVVGGDITAFFQDLTAVDAVNDVDDISFDFIVYRNQAGFAVDMPLITLGDGRPTVEKNASIKIPLSKEAVSGAFIDPALNHTLLMSFYDYLPVKADI